MKIVVLDGFSLNPGDLSWESLEKLGDVTVHERTYPEQLVEFAREAEILLTNKTPVNETHFAQLPKLKYIGVLATGYNIVDVDAAERRGIIVTNVPSYGTQAVAQYVFAHLLEICGRVAMHSDLVKSGQWSLKEEFCFWEKPLIELYGKTLGIIGTGRIGLETAKIAQAFGMKVCAYSRTVKPELETETFRFVSLYELYADSDVISLHCPLTEETRHMIDSEAFSKMKQGVILINTSRGPLIDEDALAEALQSGTVSAAGLDVLSVEPPRADHPLFKFENCNITPHIAWAPTETRKRLMGIAVKNIESFLNGNPINRVK
jgi:glycerate dehydrogenase